MLADDLARRFLHTPMNAIAKAMIARGSSRPLRDWTSAAPHDAGLSFPHEMIAAGYRLAVDRAAVYKPDPLGRDDLRRAIVAWYKRQSWPVAPVNVLITPGTSQAYFYLFRLLANPGDVVLVPRPSYPLFDDLAAVARAATRPYPLRRGLERWEIDPHGLEAAIRPDTKAIVVVSPHHPTGHVVSPAEWKMLGKVATAHGLALVVDEVYSDDLITEKYDQLPRPDVNGAPVIVLLNGLSKLLGLPGHKVGWMAIAGSDGERKSSLRQAMAHLSDTFLAASDVAQAAAAIWMEQVVAGDDVPLWLEHRRRTLKGRAMFLMRTLKAAGIAPERLDFLLPEGGVHLPLRVRDPKWDDEALALKLLEKEDLLVHPGFYYDMPDDAIVVSYSRDEAWLADNVMKLVRAMGD